MSSSFKAVLRKVIPLRASVFEKARNAMSARFASVEASLDGIATKVGALEAVEANLGSIETALESEMDKLGKLIGQSHEDASNSIASRFDAVDSSIAEMEGQNTLDYADLSKSLVILSAQLENMGYRLDEIARQVDAIETVVCQSEEYPLVKIDDQQ